MNSWREQAVTFLLLFEHMIIISSFGVDVYKICIKKTYDFFDNSKEQI